MGCMFQGLRSVYGMVSHLGSGREPTKSTGRVAEGSLMNSSMSLARILLLHRDSGVST